MGIKEIKIAKKGGRHAANVNAQRHSSSQSSIISKNKRKHNSKNIKQIFILSFDALKDRKARSALTILTRSIKQRSFTNSKVLYSIVRVNVVNAIIGTINEMMPPI